MSSCHFSSNSVTGGTGGPGSTNATGEGRGGAIAAYGGSLLLNSVTLSSNSACGGVGTPQPVNYPPGSTMPDTSGDACGGAVYITNASVQLLNCLLTNNVCKTPGGGLGAAARGGAIFLASGDLAFSNTWLNANTACGGNAISPSYLGTIWGAPGSAYGGAVAASSGTVTFTRCQVLSNHALGGGQGGTLGTGGFTSGTAQGGAVFSAATLSVSDTSFSQNSAAAGSASCAEGEGRGGALCNLNFAALNGCSFISNSVVGGSAGGNANRPPGADGSGGGIYNLSQLTITNCTVALNVAQGGSPGSIMQPAGLAAGGGIFNMGNLAAVNLTIASNIVAPMGAAATIPGRYATANIANAAGTFSLQNSILAYPTLSSVTPGISSNVSGTITDAGHDISSDSTANFTSSSSRNSTDPLLKPLAGNGGPTPTMALATNSPAVDSGTAVGAPSIDQRGLPRLMGKGFDIGAFELQSTPITIPNLALTKQHSGLSLSFGVGTNVSYVLRYSTNLVDWTDLKIVGPFAKKANIAYSVGTNAQPRGFYKLFVP